jgi:hypothetical protein
LGEQKIVPEKNTFFNVRRKEATLDWGITKIKPFLSTKELDGRYSPLTSNTLRSNFRKHDAPFNVARAQEGRARRFVHTRRLNLFRTYTKGSHSGSGQVVKCATRGLGKRSDLFTPGHCRTQYNVLAINTHV